MKASDGCVDLLKEFERYAERPYDDVGGKLSWGYGHLGKRGETPPASISEADATALLCVDLREAEACIDAAVDVDLTQNQYDALCSFVFNLGCGALNKSTLLQKLNRGDYTGAAGEFEKWCRVGVTQVAGLLRRRLAERALFLADDA